MTDADDWKARVTWPAEGYRDEDGELHPWTDPVPDEDGVVHPGDDYTYQELVGDQAEAAHMDVQEFLESMRYDFEGWAASAAAEKLSPPWINDGNGLGE